MHSIIVVEDDIDLRKVISEYLQLRGFDVIGYGTNGLEAVQLYEEHRPDFVLMDISMPNYDGIYGLENIKRINSNANVVMLTGNYSEDLRQKLTALNATRILQKPCDMNNLVEVINTVSSVNAVQVL